MWGFCICGRDKSGPYSCEQIAITLLTDWNNAWRIGRKLSTFAHEIRCEHTVRRRGPIHRARIYLLSILWVIVIILWGVIHCMWGFCICGRDKSVPYSCERIGIMRGEHTPLGERIANMRGEMNGDK